MRIVLKYDTNVRFKAGEVVDVCKEERARLFSLGMATDAPEDANEAVSEAVKAPAEEVHVETKSAPKTGSKRAKKA